MWTVGVDTGGTFTDLVALSDSGDMRLAKVPSTPPSFDRGVIKAIRAVGLSGDQLRMVVHGTTATTNAAITKTGARTALITTKGFRDVLEIRRGNRAELFDILWDPPDPLVPRYNRFEVQERVNYQGVVLTKLKEQDVRRILKTLQKRKIEALAVCFLHSYANPSHERRVQELAQEILPDLFVCLSSDILPEPLEFERTATTVANAYLGPVLTRYLAALEESLRKEMAFEGDLFTMHSGGGVMTSDAVRSVPVKTVNSGPAAGVIATATLGAVCKRENVISLDMGGTSCDIAVIVDGQPRVANQSYIEWGVPIQFPSVDLVAVGAGGGSIAWIDAAGYPRSGPHSAGAVPGPACYAKGGKEPTNTDANVVLGRLSPTALLGGAVTIDERLAAETIESRIAQPLGLDVITAADGIIRISNANMSKGIRLMTIERGLDPREFTLVAFGGAGPLHAVDLARELQISEVIIPPSPGVTSALGLLFADVSADFSQSVIMRQGAIDVARLESVYAHLEQRAGERLRRDGVRADAMRMFRQIDLRYVGQLRALTVPVDSGPLTLGAMDKAMSRFHGEHQREYRYVLDGQPVETYILRVSATGDVAKPRFDRIGQSLSSGDAVVGTRDVFFSQNGSNGFLSTRIYDRARLAPGSLIEGPAVIEQLDSTTLLPPESRAEINEGGALLITFDRHS